MRGNANSVMEPCDEWDSIDKFGGVELMGNGSVFAVFFDVDTTGDGFADDREMLTFDTEEEAEAYMVEILQHHPRP